MSELIDLTSADFEEKVKNGKSVVMFYASKSFPNCPHCVKARQVLKEKPLTVPVYQVDADLEKEIATKYGAKSFPLFLFFKDGKVYNSHRGDNIALIQNMIDLDGQEITRLPKSKDIGVNIERPVSTMTTIELKASYYDAKRVIDAATARIKQIEEALKQRGE